jgi:hypothetical protein
MWLPVFFPAEVGSHSNCSLFKAARLKWLLDKLLVWQGVPVSSLMLQDLTGSCTPTLYGPSHGDWSLGDFPFMQADRATSCHSHGSSPNWPVCHSEFSFTHLPDTGVGGCIYGDQSIMCATWSVVGEGLPQKTGHKPSRVLSWTLGWLVLKQYWCGSMPWRQIGGGRWVTSCPSPSRVMQWPFIHVYHIYIYIYICALTTRHPSIHKSWH